MFVLVAWYRCSCFVTLLPLLFPKSGAHFVLVYIIILDARVALRCLCGCISMVRCFAFRHYRSLVPSISVGLPIVSCSLLPSL